MSDPWVLWGLFSYFLAALVGLGIVLMAGRKNKETMSPDSWKPGRDKLTTEQIKALRPFLRCLGVMESTSWAFIDPDGRRRDVAPAIPLAAFVALHDAFRHNLMFSDVWSDEEPQATGAEES